MKYLIMRDRRVVVCERYVAVPDDFDLDNEDHEGLLERFFDGAGWDNERTVSGSLELVPLTTADGSMIQGIPLVDWEDLNDP